MVWGSSGLRGGLEIEVGFLKIKILFLIVGDLLLQEKVLLPQLHNGVEEIIYLCRHVFDGYFGATRWLICHRQLILQCFCEVCDPFLQLEDLLFFDAKLRFKNFRLIVARCIVEGRIVPLVVSTISVGRELVIQMEGCHLGEGLTRLALWTQEAACAAVFSQTLLDLLWLSRQLMLVVGFRWDLIDIFKLLLHIFYRGNVFQRLVQHFW